MILVRVDAVVDHLDLFGVDREEAQHVVAGFLGNGDHGIGLGDAVVLDPGAEVIGVAELFHLPRPQRLQRMGGQHKGDTPQLLRHESAELDIPGMAVDDGTWLQLVFRHQHAAIHRIQCAAEARIGVLPGIGPRRVPLHAQVWLRHILLAEAADFDGNQARKLTAEVLDVYPRAAVHMRWVFVRKERDLVWNGHEVLL